MLQMFQGLALLLGNDWSTIGKAYNWPFCFTDFNDCYDFCYKLRDCGYITQDNVDNLLTLVTPLEKSHPGLVQLVEDYQAKYCKPSSEKHWTLRKLELDPLLQMFQRLDDLLGNDWLSVTQTSDWPFCLADCRLGFDFYKQLADSGYIRDNDVTFLLKLLLPLEKSHPGLVQLIKEYQANYCKPSAKA